MKVVLKHLNGTAKANAERAKEELNRVLAFRGDIVSVKPNGRRITLNIAINPKWENNDKVSYLKEWIPAKGKTVFNVTSIE